MNEPQLSNLWESVHRKQGTYANTFRCCEGKGMEALRVLFPDGEADEFNFVLFSTSGANGSYLTIEDTEELEEESREVTFVAVSPRIVCLRYGNCRPETEEDYQFLKRLRQTSWEVVNQIGRHLTQRRQP